MSQTITVRDMSCDHCEESVEEALESVREVSAATADRESGTATVEGDADTGALLEAVEAAGYEASA